MTNDEMTRFWAKVNKIESGCWIWTACVTMHGYGQFWFRGSLRGAHRASWIMHRGYDPVGLDLDHLCRVPACVNPDHLEPVTHAENLRRGKGGSNMSAKTHCPQRHEYTPENTKLYQGRRYCRECHRIDARRRRAANRK